MYFDAHSDIWCDVTARRLKGETDVLRRRHLERLRKGGVEVVSCPTCGRTRIDLIHLANQVETMVSGMEGLDGVKVAVMGCVVNGPGEAREADIGIAGGVGEGLIIKKGEILRKVPEEDLLDSLRSELEAMAEARKK